MRQTFIEDLPAVTASATAAGVMVGLCTIQKPDGNFDASGAPSGNFVNVAGLVNIPCMHAPFSPGNVTANEAKAVPEIQRLQPRHVTLNGYYPQVVTLALSGTVRAIIDGLAYEVWGAESDSQNQQTRLKVDLRKV